MRIANPRFRRFHQREDLDAIHEMCTRDSIKFNDPQSNETLYHDSWIRHPPGFPDRAQAPPVSVCMGGGTFSPNREETRTHYMNTYHPFDKSAIPKLALAPPDSDILPHDDLPRLSTQHASMREHGWKWAYDAETARNHYDYHHYKHFDLGHDGPTTRSTMGASYTARPPVPQAEFDSRFLRESSISWDPEAGLGPHAKSLTKRRLAPAIADAPRIDYRAKSFDVGYTPTDYTSTTQDTYVRQRCVPRQPIHGPPCSEFADHGPHAQKWASGYSQDYVKKTPIPNPVDQEFLKRGHIEVGYSNGDWPTAAPWPPPSPTEAFKGLQASNEVWRGDGLMRSGTATRDATRRPDTTRGGGRQPMCLEGKKDKVYLGSDPTTKSTTARDMNTLAGTGKPAQIYIDEHEIRGPGMGRGGAWDRLAPQPIVSANDVTPVTQLPPIDGSWQLQTHFELDATEKNKGKINTTYFKEICEPSLDRQQLRREKFARRGR
jgi:hypothetical protein